MSAVFFLYIYILNYLYPFLFIFKVSTESWFGSTDSARFFWLLFIFVAICCPQIWRKDLVKFWTWALSRTTFQSWVCWGENFRQALGYVVQLDLVLEIWKQMAWFLVKWMNRLGINSEESAYIYWWPAGWEILSIGIELIPEECL